MCPNRHSKLLNPRDFRAGSGFPLCAKTGYNLPAANGREHRLGTLPGVFTMTPKYATGRAKFRAYMLQTKSMR
jgi:hypothetical protein